MIQKSKSIRAIFVVALSLIGLFIAAISLTLWALRSDAIREADNDTGNIAAVLSGQIARSIQSVDLVLAGVRDNAANVMASNTDGEHSIESLEQYEFLIKNLSRLSQADAIAIIGKDGRAANSTSQWPPSGTDVSDRDYFKHFRATNEDRIYISNLVKNRVSGVRTIFFARRISGRQNEFLGVALIGLQVTYFDSIYNSIKALRNQSFLLLHPDGSMLIRSPEAPIRGDNRMPAGSPWYDVVASGGGSYRSPGYFDNEARYVSVRPLTEYPLVVNVAVQETAVLAKWRDRAAFIALGSLLAVGCSALLLWFLRRQIKRMSQSDAALEERSRDLERLFDTSLDLILVTNGSGDLLRVSPISLAILGYKPQEMIGRNAKDFILPADLENIRQEMLLARKGQQVSNFEARYVHKDGEIVILSWSGVWSQPDQKHYFTGRDVSESKVTEEKLKRLAHFDQLTGLPNRVSLQSDLGKALQVARAEGAPTSIALFDLDGFKDVNDTLGHTVGDCLLKTVATRLGQVDVGAGDFYRLGGDEFVLVKPGCGDPLDIAQSVESALKCLSTSFDINGHQLYIGASAGVAIAPADGADAEELMSNADLALYDAKAVGGNIYRLFMPRLRAKAEARRVMDAELRRAATDNEFELFYQPQVSADSGRVNGAEALLRWNHPVRGLLTPAAFIDALAESQAVLEVGRSILMTACAKAAEWRKAGLHLERIGVNLFPAQYNGGTLLEDVEKALRDSGLPAAALEIEITENVALGEQETGIEVLHMLRAKGVNLAFDDFGTGYASLSYLTRYPLTRLKIDRSFVCQIDGASSPEQTAIVRSIIVMAHNLGLGVVAEGVETHAQAAFLRSERCDELQGYLFSKPLSASEFELFLRRESQRPQTRKTAAI